MGGMLSDSMRAQKDAALTKKFGINSHQIQGILDSWHELKKYGTEKAGVILFKKFFIIAPETLNMFKEFSREKDWEQSPLFRHHCKIWMNVMGSAVILLKDPDSLESTLEYLGMKHDGLAITKQHFLYMGDAMVETLSECLGPDIATPEVLEAWKIMYKYIVQSVVEGMDQREQSRIISSIK